MTPRKERAEKRKNQEDPDNYRCGGCKRVNVYDPAKHLVCPHCKYGTPQES